MTEQTDCELIELAAKAYGGIPIPLVWIRPFDNELTPINNRGEPWNPLTDDGDALRLAVKLMMVVDTEYNGGSVAGNATVAFSDPEYGYQDGFGYKDLYAATRRAITRAAAAIGETMP